LTVEVVPPDWVLPTGAAGTVNNPANNFSAFVLGIPLPQVL
jgi:hypothetical protein